MGDKELIEDRKWDHEERVAGFGGSDNVPVQTRIGIRRIEIRYLHRGDGGGGWSGGGGGRRRPLSLLLLVGDAAGLGLHVADLPEVEADGAGAEGVGLRLPAVLLEGCPEAADEGVEAAPGLPERARAGRRRVGVAEEGAHRRVHLGLPELVEVPEELQHVGAAAPGESERRPVVLQVLAEGVPIPPLLRLVAARRCRPRNGAGFVA